MAQDQPLISIIDDDDGLRTALMGLVRSLGYRVDGYANAEAFLDAGAGAQSACIVSDIQMSGLSGIELKARLDQTGCRAPVILITARTEPELQAKARASGALCVLKKPFAPDALLACIDQALAGAL